MKTKTLDIDDYIHEKRKQIDQTLDNLIPERSVPYNELFQAARYSLLTSAKRLRPILAIAIAESLSVTEIPLSIPCALELVHTYSLIHDDLPCMDDDDIRRGKPSLHKAYSEGCAVLTGDYLLTKAFELIATEEKISPEKKIALITSLSKHSGSDGMIGGQLLDLQNEGKEIEIDTLRIIHLNKTAAPFIAAAEFGAILAEAPQAQQENLKLFATQIGLAFQIIDDVIDITGPNTGKPLGSDQTNGKYTYVNIMGIDQAKEAAEYLYQNALAALEMILHDTTLVKELSSLLVYRDK